jgi:hypothetical protein
MHNDSDDVDDDDDDNDDDDDDDDDDDNNNNNNQDIYMITYRDKITQPVLHQTLRSTIEVRKSMNSVMHSNVSASLV